MTHWQLFPVCEWRGRTEETDHVSHEIYFTNMHVTLNPMFTFVCHVSGSYSVNFSLSSTLPVRAIFVIFTRLFSGNHCAAELIGIQKGSMCDSAWLNKRRLLDLGRGVYYSSSDFIQWTRPQFIIRTQCGGHPVISGEKILQKEVQMWLSFYPNFIQWTLCTLVLVLVFDIQLG